MATQRSETREQLLQDYAAGGISWRELQSRGFQDYVEVLGGLGDLGLRPPIAPLSGPSGEARQRAVSWLEARLAASA